MREEGEEEEEDMCLEPSFTEYLDCVDCSAEERSLSAKQDVLVRVHINSCTKEAS